MNTQDELYMACSFGELEEVKTLIADGADPEQVDGDHMSALHHACVGGDLDVVRYLVEEEELEFTETYSELMDASREGHLEVVKYIVENHGWNEEYEDQYLNAALDAPDAKDCLNYLRENGFHAREGAGDRVLQKAVTFDDYDEAKQCLEDGVDPDTPRSAMFPPIWRAIENENPEMVELLLAHGADPNLVFDGGPTLLNLAVRRKNVEIAELLLEHGADPNLSVGSEDVNLPLVRAVKEDHLGMVKLLLDEGADPDPHEHVMDSPVYFAEMLQNEEMKDLLISHGAEWEADDGL